MKHLDEIDRRGCAPASVPEPAAVDWDALTRNAKAVGELLQMWRAIERQREIEADDEDWLMF
jgi:hypothetical protein